MSDIRANNILIARNSLILYVRLFTTSIIALLVSRFLLEGLGVEDYGIYNVVGGVVVMMAFLNSIMISTTYRYIAFELGAKDGVGVNVVFSVSLVIHIVIAFLVILLTETLGVYYVKNYLNIEISRIADAIYVMRFSSFATVLTVLSAPFQGVIIAKERFRVQALIEIFRSLLNLGVAVWIISLASNQLRSYASMIFLVNAVPPIFYFTYCKRKFAAMVEYTKTGSIKLYKEILTFSSWNLLGASAHMGRTTGTALVINYFFGAILNAALGVATQVNNFVLMFSMNLAQAVNPQITKSYSSGDVNRTFNLTAYTSKYTWYLMALPSIPLLLETDLIYEIWLTDVPHYSVRFTQLVILSTLLGGIGNGIMSMVQATGKVKYFQIVLSTTSLISLPIACFAYDQGYSPDTVFFVIMASTTLNIILSQLLLKYILYVDILSFMKISYLRIFYVVLFMLPVFYGYQFIPQNMLRLVLGGTGACTCFLGLVYIVGLDAHEKGVIKKLALNYLNNFK